MKHQIHFLVFFVVFLANASGSTFHEQVRSLDTSDEKKQQLIQSFEESVIESFVRGCLEKLTAYLEYFAEAESLQVYFIDDRIRRKNRKLWFDRQERWKPRASISDKDYISNLLHNLIDGIKESEKRGLSFDEEGRMLVPRPSNAFNEIEIKLKGFRDGIEFSISLSRKHTTLLMETSKNSSMTMRYRSSSDISEILTNISNKSVVTTPEAPPPSS